MVKDQFCTPSLGMDTTCGSFLLKGQKAIEDAVAIQKLQDAGATILAKANLTELGHKKGVKLTSGWSAVGGQTQSPYVRGGVRSDAMPLGHTLVRRQGVRREVPLLSRLGSVPWLLGPRVMVR